jgi:hypothetical protein
MQPGPDVAHSFAAINHDPFCTRFARARRKVNKIAPAPTTASTTRLLRSVTGISVGTAVATMAEVCVSESPTSDDAVVATTTAAKSTVTE